MLNRSTPKPFLPHGRLENQVSGLRDSTITPDTYRKYQQQSNGSVVFIGEFPTPEISFGLWKRNK